MKGTGNDLFDVWLPHKRFPMTQETVSALHKLTSTAGPNDLCERLGTWANELGRRRGPFKIVAGDDVNALVDALCRGRPLSAELNELLNYLTQRLGRKCRGS